VLPDLGDVLAVLGVGEGPGVITLTAVSVGWLRGLVLPQVGDGRPAGVVLVVRGGRMTVSQGIQAPLHVLLRARLAAG
jgi:hypothetical protein